MNLKVFTDKTYCGLVPCVLLKPVCLTGQGHVKVNVKFTECYFKSQIR